MSRAREMQQREACSRLPSPVTRIVSTMKKWMLLMVLTTIMMMGCMSATQGGQEATSPSYVSQFVTDPAKGRDFREPSVHPNGEELLFVECSRELEPNGGCYALRYHLTMKTLQRYVLPDGYFYSTAKFSPQGNFILMYRVPKHDREQDAVRNAYENAEIVVMKTDGTDFRVLPLAKGNKLAPIMSPDESRVAYWRSVLRPPGNKTFSHKFDVWEVNLHSGEDTLFAGPFAFFDRSNLQYVSSDALIVGADGPSKYASTIFQYHKRYNRSVVYRISRGTTTLPEPILTEVEGANWPCSDRAGNLYFRGQRSGISLFRKSPKGSLQQWHVLRETADVHSLVAASDGSYLVFIYNVRGTHLREGSKGMGWLSMQTSEWKNLNIPSLKSSTPIVVHLKSDHVA